MLFDFFIETIQFDFKTFGKGDVKLIFNGKPIKNSLEIKTPPRNNTVEISFSKTDPADVESYALLHKVLINGFDCVDMFKEISYQVDSNKHKVDKNIFPNNLYFGYIGKMNFELSHKNDLLSQAAWTIADKEFNELKWPQKGEHRREKNFTTLHKDSRYMFTGCQPPSSDEITSLVDNLEIGSLSMPVEMMQFKNKIEKWIDCSNHIHIENFQEMKHFTVSNGVTDSLSTFLLNNKSIYMKNKMYYHNKAILENKDVKIKDISTDTPDAGSKILLEFPSPWYSTSDLIDTIIMAKKLGCYVAIDLTWLPVTNTDIKLDLSMVDEIYFSMNKCWPIQNLRPAFRWSKTRINDSQTFNTEYCIYSKIPINVFDKLIEKFPLDYIIDKQKSNHKSICKTFGLTPTDVLWFTRHENFKHDSQHYISKHFYLDDFVCVVNLLNNKDKFFW